MKILHFYQIPGLSKGSQELKLKELQELSHLVLGLETETCYNIEVDESFNQEDIKKLKWLLSSPFYPEKTQLQPFLVEKPGKHLIEIGPRLNFSSPFSTNSVSICHAVGLTCVQRLEKSIRYLIHCQPDHASGTLIEKLLQPLYDIMTECQYFEPLKSFDHGIIPEDWFIVDVMTHGRKALEEVNSELGLAFDDWDLDFYCKLFKEKLERNPTSVECFDLAQSNSEHSRHWFFKGIMVIDGKEQSLSLIDMIMETQKTSNQNNVIKFSDNSSAIQGYKVSKLVPKVIGEPSSFIQYESSSHIIFTAETHNFPTGVAPFSGATTGTGGRIRDVQAVGRGGHCIAGTAGYSVGNLLIPGYEQSWENKNYVYPENLAKPLKILIDASNGASDYGNKFGEPLICGFTRSFGLEDSFGERREWIKPIMFSGGVGVMEANMIHKMPPVKGMLLAKVGGPAYRIGVGGGSASSVQVHGDNKSDLDFGAVQRGDAEMENKLNRIIRACIEEGDQNPICSIHDQGAGGNGNVLKELVEPEGAIIFTNAFTLGDKTMSTLELWGAEYQENNAILLQPQNEHKLKKLAQRERCNIDVVGVVTGNGKVILSEDKNTTIGDILTGEKIPEEKAYPFNLDLELILGKMPKKKYFLEEEKCISKPLKIPSDVTVMHALNQVLRLVTVCSKRFLTNKVDRCVTGLVAQQQCVGPIHTPLADFAVTGISMFNVEGIATAIGEQPLKGLINPSAGGRMTVAEALTNLMFVKISCLRDVKCSGNWMWAAKLKGEGAALYKTCEAMCKFMSELGIAIDGGKDSLSMAARVNDSTVKAPGTLVVSVYAPCPDIRVLVTPDIKSPGMGRVGTLIWISLSDEHRLGGSAFSQCFSQLGSDVPDVESASLLRQGFEITQRLISENKVLAGHDISDGGLITCILEMAFGGLSGLKLKIDTKSSLLDVLFAEEVGWIIEIDPNDTEYVMNLYAKHSIKAINIGESTNYGMDSLITLKDLEHNVIFERSLHSLYQVWEETSYQLECKQANVECVTEEFLNLKDRKGPNYHLSFNPDNIIIQNKILTQAPRVAVLREEGTNGDREMAASLYMAGFETWDVTMQDLLDEKITVDQFRGVIFPGGFSYADVLGSAKGWAACLLFNEQLRRQFEAFKRRLDTFSLGVCNGCQLMSMLGWVGTEISTEPNVYLAPNISERFECRFSTVRIEKTPSIMCREMDGSALGIWIAHGEGRFTFRNQDTLRYLEENNCIALRYVDDDGQPTENYPLNPNGSTGGIAGICSKDGRHLALMPHPERCTLMWQWPYVPSSMKDLKVSPWLRLFQNAFNWVMNS